MRLWPSTLLLLAGCAQLFGLDETTGGDASVDVASVQVQRVQIGATVIRGPLDMSMQTAAFFADDGAGGLTKVDGTLMGTDTFTAQVAGTPTAMYSVPGRPEKFRQLLMTGARAQKANASFLEHPNAMPPFPSSQIALNVTLPSAYVSGQSFRIDAIGAWMGEALVAADLPLPDMALGTINSTIPYTRFTPTSSTLMPTRITSADQVLVLRYTGNDLTGVLQAQFEQTDATDTVAGNMNAVTANQTLAATVDPAALATRYSAVRPAVGTPGMSWRINAVPGWQYGSTTGTKLTNGTVAAADTMINAMYGNPFESLDWKAVVTFSTSASRTYTHQQVAVPLYASTTTIATPGAGLDFNVPAGMPITIRANGTTLTSDGGNLTVDPTKAVEVDAVLDRTTNSYYTVALVEIEVTGTEFTRTVVAEAITTGMPSFKLPPELFVAGHSYYFAFRCAQGGFSELASGDVQTFTLPFTYTSADSGLFTVVAP